MRGSPALLASGLALLALAAAIVARQRRAAQCARHDPRVGAVAMVLAAACLVGGLALLQIGLAG